MRTEPELVRVGRIGRVHGLAGELTLEDTSLTPLELHHVKTFVWRGATGETRPLALATVRPAHRRLLVRFEGCEDREGALALAGGALMAEPARLPDPGPNVAYTFQLLGLEVRTEDGRALGVLEDVLASGAHPVYVVRGERELMIPATPEVLKRVSLAEGVIVVALPAGLEEL